MSKTLPLPFSSVLSLFLYFICFTTFYVIQHLHSSPSSASSDPRFFFFHCFLYSVVSQHESYLISFLLRIDFIMIPASPTLLKTSLLVIVFLQLTSNIASEIGSVLIVENSCLTFTRKSSTIYYIFRFGVSTDF